MHTLQVGVEEELDVWHDAAPVVASASILRCVVHPAGQPQSTVSCTPVVRRAKSAVVLGLASVPVLDRSWHIPALPAGHYVLHIEVPSGTEWMRIYSEVIRIVQ